jgi:hypothetical protein
MDNTEKLCGYSRNKRSYCLFRMRTLSYFRNLLFVSYLEISYKRHEMLTFCEHLSSPPVETGNIGYTRRRKIKQKHSTIYVGYHYAKTNRNNVNKTWAILQTTGAILEYEYPIYICNLNIEIDIIRNTFMLQIRVITKLPNSEQSYKGKVKTHKYINRQNQSTTGKLWKP